MNMGHEGLKLISSEYHTLRAVASPVFYGEFQFRPSPSPRIGCVNPQLVYLDTHGLAALLDASKWASARAFRVAHVKGIAREHHCSMTSG